jgi:peroxiredoxin
MVELGQLEAHHQEFEARKVRIVAVSLDELENSARTQKRFPHLMIVSDKDESLAKAAAVLGPQHAPDGSDTVSPTTVLIDRRGQVRWVFRPNRYINRLSPEELLAAVDANLRDQP